MLCGVLLWGRVVATCWLCRVAVWGAATWIIIPPHQGGLCVRLQWEQRPGETIYKGHRSYDLMLNLQLGIRWSVGKITPELVGATLPEETFAQKVAAADKHCCSGSEGPV